MGGPLRPKKSLEISIIYLKTKPYQMVFCSQFAASSYNLKLHKVKTAPARKFMRQVFLLSTRRTAAN